MVSRILGHWTSNSSENNQMWNNFINYWHNKWHKYIERNNKNYNGSDVEDNAEYIDIVQVHPNTRKKHHCLYCSE